MYSNFKLRSYNFQFQPRANNINGSYKNNFNLFIKKINLNLFSPTYWFARAIIDIEIIICKVPNNYFLISEQNIDYS